MEKENQKNTELDLPHFEDDNDDQTSVLPKEELDLPPALPLRSVITPPPISLSIKTPSLDDLTTEDQTVTFARKPNLASPTFAAIPEEKPTRKPDIKVDEPFSKTHPIKDTPQRIALKPALPRDRFAAFLIDNFLITALIIFSHAPSFIKNLLNSFSFLQGLPAWVSTSLEIGGYLVLGFFYFLLFEMIGGFTPGKLICRLRVVNLLGQSAGLKGIFLRNLIRFFDLIFFFLAVLSIESSPSYQRLGDRAAQTMVIKKTRKRLKPIDLRQVHLSSASTRTFAFLIDLALFVCGIMFALAALNPDGAHFKTWLQVIPFAAILYFPLLEFIISTTPGKVILRNEVVLENGEPLDGTSAWWRNFVRPIDLLLGYPLLAVTHKKQRLGDLIADTFVIRKKPQPNALITLGVVLVAVAILGYIAKQNPRRTWIQDRLQIELQQFNQYLNSRTQTVNSVTSSISKPAPREKPQSNSQTLMISDFSFSLGPDPSQVVNDSRFVRGDTIYTFFKLAGYSRNQKSQVHVQQEVQLENQTGTLVFQKPLVAAYAEVPPANSERLWIANSIAFPKDLPSGQYRLVFILKDIHLNRQIVYEKNISLQ